MEIYPQICRVAWSPASSGGAKATNNARFEDYNDMEY